MWAQVPFPSGKVQATSPTALSYHPPGAMWGGGRCLFAPSSPPFWGKLFYLAAGKHQIQWVSKKEQARLSVLVLGEIHLGAGRPEIQLLLQGLFMCFKIKQPMVLVTGIQVSPLPGECPDPRAAESCSLLPSGASGFGFTYLFIFLLSSFSRKGVCEPLSSSAVR